MKGTVGIYKGRIIDKKIFRAFVYGTNGEKKLVESWDEFEESMQSGVWFATRKDALASKAVPESEPKAKRARAKPKPKVILEDVEPPQDEEVLEDDGSVFEVKDVEL